MQIFKLFSLFFLRRLKLPILGLAQRNAAGKYGAATCLLFTVYFLLTTPAFSQENLCLTCHGQFKRPAKFVHAALRMGCEICHQTVEGMKHPQQKRSIKLTQDMRGLCYGCHDESKFKGKVIHFPVAGGMCTGCHNPHQSEFNKILIGKSPDFCYNCHDRGEFTKKNVHAALFMGCGSCHSPHVSENNVLLLQKTINELCLQCHPGVPKRPHAVAGFGSRGHPLEGPKDPAREGREFSCSSCHNPHSSNSPRLFRFDAKSGMALCINCHKL